MCECLPRHFCSVVIVERRETGWCRGGCGREGKLDSNQLREMYWPAAAKLWSSPWSLAQKNYNSQRLQGAWKGSVCIEAHREVVCGYSYNGYYRTFAFFLYFIWQFTIAMRMFSDFVNWTCDSVKTSLSSHVDLRAGCRGSSPLKAHSDTGRQDETGLKVRRYLCRKSHRNVWQQHSRHNFNYSYKLVFKINIM